MAAGTSSCLSTASLCCQGPVRLPTNLRKSCHCSSQFPTQSPGGAQQLLVRRRNPFPLKATARPRRKVKLQTFAQVNDSQDLDAGQESTTGRVGLESNFQEERDAHESKEQNSQIGNPVFRTVGNSVSWGVSTTGRGLTAIQTGLQDRWRKARRRRKPLSERDPDSTADSDSDSDWDGSEQAVLLTDTDPEAVAEPEAYSRQQQEGASTSDRPEKGSEEKSEEPWDTIKRWWNNPAFFRFRVSLSMANLTMALPTFIARVSAMYPVFVAGLQSQLLTGQLSLPIMAPLLFGGGIAFKAITTNLGFVLPRLAMAGGVLWLLWAANYAMQEAIAHLRNNGTIDRKISNVLVLSVELVASTIGLVTILSSVGIKISSLLLPGFAAIALAGKDVWHNYFAGFFLFAAQPFRPGDSVALLCGAGGAASAPTSAVPPGWFEGVCESVDLRYTVLRNGRQRLLVPNAHFVNREFLVTDAGPVVNMPATVRPDLSRGVKNGRAASPPGGRNGPPMPPQTVAPNGQARRGGYYPTVANILGPRQAPNGPGTKGPPVN